MKTAILLVVALIAVVGVNGLRPHDLKQVRISDAPQRMREPLKRVMSVRVNKDKQGNMYPTLLEGSYPDVPAVASFQDTQNQTGWGVLNVKTDAGTDEEQLYAAGVAEGALTAPRIYEHYINMHAEAFGKSAAPSDVIAWMQNQINWSEEQVKANPSSAVWQYVGLLLAQLNGLQDGYNSVAKTGNASIPELPPFAFQMLNGIGDLFDILPAVNKPSRPQWDSMQRDEMIAEFYKRTHCSGLVKLTGNYSDLFMAHSAWFTYGSMNRIYKHYNFQVANGNVKAKRMSFSSYPGFLESLDDFYMMDSGLGMIQTTNGIFNNSLYDLVTYKSLLAWQRVRVANAVAGSGEEWYDAFKTAASGTYTNQYMVVDFNLFEVGKPLKPNTLWVVEEIPGTCVGADETPQLERGYWPSYNRPYFPEVYDKSGYPAAAAKGGDYFTYQLNPRAQIFRRDQAKVVDMPTFKRQMRYNEYKTDPYSFDGKIQNPLWSICSRGDLNPDQPVAGGCYDTKVTSYAQGFWNLTAEAINGPTRFYNTLPVFEWTSQFDATSHVGEPQKYDFEFVTMEPTN